jgi:hypothetical protein
MVFSLATDKFLREAATALQTAVKANRFGVMQIHNLKEIMAGKCAKFARACLIERRAA